MIGSRERSTGYIHGRRVGPHSSSVIHSNYHPADHATVTEVVFSSDDELSQAVQSSKTAFDEWSAMPLSTRSDVLLRAAELLRQYKVELANLEVLDTGKPLSEVLSCDIESAADTLAYFAKAALAFESEVITQQNSFVYTLREPLGVIAAIGAWNYPLQIACWKAAPALIMGNTMVYKPSELTPLTTLRLAEIFIEAGMPQGVFNVVLGDGYVAEKLLAQPGIAKISFTGSVPTGKKILLQSAEQIIPVTLELGGKSPFIIFEDADLDQAVIGSMLANFYSQGEVCSNGTRVFVSQKQHDLFIEKLIARLNNLVIGDPFDMKTQMGPLISAAHCEKVLAHIEQGIRDRATLAYGGKRLTEPPFDKGNFVMPTVFTDCHDDMSIVKNEIFGPVMSVLSFDTENEVIERANNTTFGLAAGVFTNDIKRGHRVVKQLQAGTCWINNYNQTPLGMPFGGYKQSGFGRENAYITLSYYTQLKSIYVELGEIEHTYR